MNTLPWLDCQAIFSLPTAETEHGAKGTGLLVVGLSYSKLGHCDCFRPATLLQRREEPTAKTVLIMATLTDVGSHFTCSSVLAEN